MAATNRRAAPLQTWSVSTFRTSTFVLVLVAAVHYSGALRQTLRSLDTVLGFAAFALLWSTTYGSTRRGQQNGDATDRRSDRIPRTIVAGGWNGLSVWVASLASLAFIFTARAQIGVLPVLGLALILGGVLAFAAGATVGLAYAAIESMLARVVDRVMDWVEASPPNRSG